MTGGIRWDAGPRRCRPHRTIAGRECPGRVRTGEHRRGAVVEGEVIAAEQAGLDRFLPPFRARERPRIGQARRLRLALGELGATFIKLGQVLSTRADLLPADVIAELSRLPVVQSEPGPAA